jgi:hypothetical protein
MILIQATDEATSETVYVTHESKNVGKVTEEHTFHVYPASAHLPGAIGDKALFRFIIGGEQARELKSHL